MPVQVQASSVEQAKRLHDRLAGVPPDSAVLANMKTQIDADTFNSWMAAADLAVNNKAFYNATLKNWATPWTNRDGNKFAPLNDYTATVIGIVRDSDSDSSGIGYRQVLSGNVIYVPSPSYGAYSNSNNNAYAALEAADGDMSDSNVLIKAPSQSAVTGLPSNAVAGVITTRAAARAFFIDGTNRAMFRFTLKNHLCHDMEDVQDTTRPTDRIRQDVSRSPGGDSRIFMNTCVGCHSGMDPMAQAFAFYNFAYDKTLGDTDAVKDTGHLTYKDTTTGTGLGGTEAKYHINARHFIDGYVTPDDHWDNYWRDGPNTAIFGWAAGTGSGVGANSMLQELANSEAFAVCSVKKVFKTVCLRDPNENDRTATVHHIAGFNQMLSDFKSSNYNLKQTFKEAAVYCAGN